jgi:hypothetical protein
MRCTRTSTVLRRCSRLLLGAVRVEVRRRSLKKVHVVPRVSQPTIAVSAKESAEVVSPLVCGHRIIAFDVLVIDRESLSTRLVATDSTGPTLVS